MTTVKCEMYNIKFWKHACKGYTVVRIEGKSSPVDVISASLGSKFQLPYLNETVSFHDICRFQT